MHRLLQIGFQQSGNWFLEADQLLFELTLHSTKRNILYAFVSDGTVKYVGKTLQTLKQRTTGYKKPEKPKPRTSKITNESATF